MLGTTSNYSREQYLKAHYVLAYLRKYRNRISVQDRESIRRMAMAGNIDEANAMMHHAINEYYNARKPRMEFPDEDEDE